MIVIIVVPVLRRCVHGSMVNKNVLMRQGFLYLQASHCAFALSVTDPTIDD